MISPNTKAGTLYIIGAGPGIGKAAAERFGREDWKIVASSRNPRNLDPFVASLTGKGINAHGIVLDTTDPHAVRASMRNADRLTGGITTVLYNAAVVREQDLFSMTDADISSDLAVNVAGAMYAIRSAVEVFGTRGGTILLTGGGLAVAPHASYASLGAGKAALRNLVQGLAPDLAARGIRIATATVSTLVAPDSAEASSAAQTLWTLATQSDAPWEMTHPHA